MIFVVSGGCASFGHSCFGGHGKRSQQPDLRGPFLDSSQEMINQQYPQKSETVLEEQYSSMFDAKPSSDVRTLLKKLVRFYEISTKSNIKKYFDEIFQLVNNPKSVTGRFGRKLKFMTSKEERSNTTIIFMHHVRKYLIRRQIFPLSHFG